MGGDDEPGPAVGSVWVADLRCGARAGVRVPVKRPAQGRELDISTAPRNVLLASLRCQGERGFALLSQRWCTLQRVMVSPGRIGGIARAAGSVQSAQLAARLTTISAGVRALTKSWADHTP